MPYIAVHSAKKLSTDEALRLENGLNEAISLIPGKSQELLLIEIIDGVRMSRNGNVREDLLYVDVRCFRKAPFKDNKLFTEAVNGVLEDVLDLQEDSVYLTITEYDSWGTRGSLKSIE
ncbi:MAG: hypothetical protein Q4P08_04575 [Eubacteriales bacterium]|nr:hypothetical protein [Eubacteriales bacterium]